MDALVCDQDRQGLPDTFTSRNTRRQQAVTLHRRGHIDHAIEFYKAHLKSNPNDSCIWSNLGACLRAQQKYTAALACYRRALDIEPGSTAALGNLGNVLKDLNRLEEAIAVHQRVAAANPDDVQLLMNQASALRENRQFDEALEKLDRALEVETANAAINWERGQNLLHLGRYAEGLQAYESRWQTGDLIAPEFSCPRWRGEALQGKTILLHAEQGYGDTILAARYIPLVKRKGACIILQCKPELHRLFRGIGADRIISPDQQTPSVDYHCPLMSLMAIFKTELDSIPHPARLYSSLGARRKFSYLQTQEPACLKVGIVWSGSVTFKNNRHRAATVERFAGLAEISNVRLYSFQKGPRADDLYIHGADPVINNLAGQIADFSDTAAALEHMDVVVMTDSSLAHLAGSMGKPVINLLQYVPYWIYSSHANTTPWYPAHHLIKQPRPGDWDHCFAEASRILQGLAMEKSLARSGKE